MSWQLLVVLVVLLLMLTVVGFGLGAGQPRLGRGELPEPPAWLEALSKRFDKSRPLDAGDIRGCPVREAVLNIDLDSGRETCEIAEVESGARRVTLRLTRGRAVIRARVLGDPAALVEVKLPGEDDAREGELRIPTAGASLTVSCVHAPCRLVFAKPEER